MASQRVMTQCYKLGREKRKEERKRVAQANKREREVVVIEGNNKKKWRVEQGEHMQLAPAMHLICNAMQCNAMQCAG